jgi:hypothetical protein
MLNEDQSQLLFETFVPVQYYFNNAAIQCYPNLPNPQINFLRSEVEPNGTRYYFEVANRDQFPSELFFPAPHLPPCGLNSNSSRTWLEIYDDTDRYLYGYCALEFPDSMSSLSFYIANSSTPPNGFSIELNDRECDIQYTSNVVYLNENPCTPANFNNGILTISEVDTSPLQTFYDVQVTIRQILNANAGDGGNDPCDSSTFSNGVLSIPILDAGPIGIFHDVQVRPGRVISATPAAGNYSSKFLLDDE